MPRLVSLHVKSGIGVVRLERPPRNAINPQLQRELHATVADVSTRSDIIAVVFFGGPQTFSTGADILELAAMSTRDSAGFVSSVSATFTAIAEIPKPTVAAICGYALGGGYELALCCDRRIAADDATVGLPELRLGLIPGAGGTQRLPRLVGVARAKELIFTARTLDADDALRAGLVEQTVHPDAVYDHALRWAGQFADTPAHALAAAKRVFNAAR